MNDPALSPKEVAQQLGLCTRTVLKRIHSGEIEPAYRINQRVIRIPQSAVTEYLKPAIVGTAGTGATRHPRRRERRRGHPRRSGYTRLSCRPDPKGAEKVIHAPSS